VHYGGMPSPYGSGASAYGSAPPFSGDSYQSVGHLSPGRPMATTRSKPPQGLPRGAGLLPASQPQPPGSGSAHLHPGPSSSVSTASPYPELSQYHQGALDRSSNIGHSQSSGMPFDPARPPAAPPATDDLSWAGPELSRQRLYVVVSKSATEEQISKLFKRFGGMEYCNLKRDKKTAHSKGYCFVNFSTEESAAMAMKALNGIEFPPGSGKPLKVRTLAR
jgi:RNA recognition motif-containing protein